MSALTMMMDAGQVDALRLCKQMLNRLFLLNLDTLCMFSVTMRKNIMNKLILLQIKRV